MKKYSFIFSLLIAFIVTAAFAKGEVETKIFGENWVASPSGLVHICPNGPKVYTNDQMDSSSLPSNNVLKVFVDNANRVWALTDKGLALYDASADAFQSFDVVVYSACSTTDGSFFADKATVYSYDANENVLNPVATLPEGKDMDINEIMKWKNGTLLVADLRENILMLDLQEKEFSPIGTVKAGSSAWMWMCVLLALLAIVLAYPYFKKIKETAANMKSCATVPEPVCPIPAAKPEPVVVEPQVSVVPQPAPAYVPESTPTPVNVSKPVSVQETAPASQPTATTPYQPVIGTHPDLIPPTRTVAVPQPVVVQEEPEMPQPEIDEEPVPDIHTANTLAQASVLFVDDDYDLINYFRDEYEEDVREIHMAYNGKEAIEVLKNGQIDVVVSDVMMPEMDGFEFCHYVKTTVEFSHIPIVLLTARTDEASRALGYKNGADEYVNKPFDADELRETLAKLFSQRKSTREQIAQGDAPMPDVKDITYSSADEAFLDRFNSFVVANVSNPNLNTKMLVEEMCMCRSLLYNKVTALTGLNIKEYVNKVRVDKVKDMLDHTDLSMSDVAERCGYSSARYFSTAFKDATGMTPSEYRNRVR